MATGVYIPPTSEVLERACAACADNGFVSTLYARGELTDAEALAMAIDRMLGGEFEAPDAGAETVDDLRDEIAELREELRDSEDERTDAAVEMEELRSDLANVEKELAELKARVPA